MIKKFFLIALVILTLVSPAWAGNWCIHPSYNSNETQNIVDTKDKVYYLVSHNLYCYDKETRENESLNKTNYLNDVDITEIYFNDYKEYLLITYSNSNVDVITKEGKVINLPDIKMASIIGSKAINDVTFSGNGRVYMATDFGYVVINDNKWEVLESRNFGQEVASAAQVGENILLAKGATVYYGSINKHYETLESFNEWTDRNNGRIYPLTDSTFLQVARSIGRVVITSKGDGNLELTRTHMWPYSGGTVHKTSTGYIINSQDGVYLTFNNEGILLEHERYGNEIFSSYAGGDGTLWSITKDGVHSDKDTATYYKPNATTLALPFFLTYNDKKKLLYVSSTGTNQQIDEQFFPTAINTYDQNRWNDITPQPKIENGGTYYPVFSPDDDHTYFLASWWKGIYKVTDGEIAFNYYWENSPLQHAYNEYYCFPTIAFDQQGNLWAVQAEATPENTAFVLPRAKLNQNSSTESDWVTVNVNGMKGNKRATLLFPKKSNINVFTNGNYGEPLIFFSTSKALSSTASSKIYTNKSLFDQDETIFNWTYITTLVEDNAGMVWMGTDRGVVSFDPSKGLQNDFRINHLKVPRNDGTNLADYLLDGIYVNCIATDAANRKWIGTNGSGLFLVSADGSEVLEKFNTDNSPLLSNNIYQVCCDPNSNSIYITTPQGLMEYVNNSAPAQDNYSNVYTYPNPVTPEYGGLITITGLMENSLVKIADAGGNVVKQVKSSGGIATWDGCNHDGEQVKSGVYFIIASQSESTGTEAVVSKILIMR